MKKLEKNSICFFLEKETFLLISLKPAIFFLSACELKGQSFHISEKRTLKTQAWYFYVAGQLPAVISIILKQKLGVVAHTCDYFSTQETEAGGLLQLWGPPGNRSKHSLNKQIKGNKTITLSNPSSLQILAIVVWKTLLNTHSRKCVNKMY